jgi:hypothetical protein
LPIFVFEEAKETKICGNQPSFSVERARALALSHRGSYFKQEKWLTKYGSRFVTKFKNKHLCQNQQIDAKFNQIFSTSTPLTCQHQQLDY